MKLRIFWLITLCFFLTVSRYYRHTVSMAVIGVGAAVLSLVLIVALGKEVDKEMEESW